jgi:hypothetical protein
MRMRSVGIFVIGALLLFAPCARAQVSTRDSLGTPAHTLTGDSLASKSQSDTGFVMRKSPGGAVLRSALLPGLGQFYNESYWKIPVILGLGAYLVRGIIVEHSNYADYRDQYAASITTLEPAGNSTLKYYREFYRDNRDTYAWWFAVLYLVQIADAFVDAHLYDFDVSDEVHSSLQLFPSGRVGMQIRW